MGNMSASDAAPLPKLGEVFFDVRGSSRSMRLSWYSDTGIAVFSIWQGGTCTGTFRLPMEELPRLVGALHRGPADAPDFRGQGQAIMDPRAGMSRQYLFPGGAVPPDPPGQGPSSQGAPTDPRLRVVPGYGGSAGYDNPLGGVAGDQGGYDGDFTGPATGDFR